MTFAALLQRCYDETGYQTAAGTPAQAIIARFSQFINDGVRYVLSKPGMARLNDGDGTFVLTSVANQARYVVPESVAIIKDIVDKTNTRTLNSMGIGRYRAIESAPTTNTGIPRFWVPLGRVAVATQPTTADQIWVVSTNAADGNTVTAYLEGLGPAGQLRTDSIALSGAMAVQFPAFTDWATITDWYIGPSVPTATIVPAVGTITLLQTSGAGLSLATISPGHTRPRYRGFYLWPTPAGTYSYNIDYRLETQDLVNPTDEPPWNADHHPCLVDYAVWREWQLKNDARAAGALARFTDGFKRLHFETQWAADEIPVARSKPIGHSRLGGQFPPDTWTIS